MTTTPNEIETTRLLLIVVGAHLRAEVADRPLAEALRERVQEWVEAKRPTHDDSDWVEPMAVVCTDIWYLNNDDLRARSHPGPRPRSSAALAAYLADRLETAFVVEDVLAVQVDLDFVDPVASCWGTDADSTAQAVEAFCDRYLDGFLESAVKRLAESA